jgi:hypothetical protein
MTADDPCLEPHHRTPCTLAQDSCLANVQESGPENRRGYLWA